MEFAPKVILSIITLVIGFWIIGRIGHILENTLKKREIDTTIVPFIVSLVTVGLKVMLLVSVAGIIGIQTTSFVAVLGAMGLAVGLALQGSLGHFASGVLLLVFKPYKVGDLIKIGDHTGVVEEIQIFNTVLRTLDNKKVIIPNGVVTTGTIINISGQGEIRVDMTYSICEKEDIDRARRIVQQVADASPLILKNIPVDIFVNSFTPDGVEFAVRPWCKSEHFWDVYFYMQENIKKAFAREKVGAPIPNITVFNKPS
ncbi:MAG: mechanosensitive ion channel [Saprospiraceae bacterium]|nr:mechanosensitive ion channel [Saprospiraceae bacterium]